MPTVLPIFSAALLYAITAVAAANVIQQPAPAATPAPDVTTLGPQVGEKVPEFSLPDHRGKPQTLASLMGPKGLVLVFSRSADW